MQQLRTFSGLLYGCSGLAFFLLVFIYMGCFIDTAAADFPVDENFNFTQIVQYHGYVCETHRITTQDGYILTAFRIPHGRDDKVKRAAPRPAVILQHGLLDSAFT